MRDKSTISANQSAWLVLNCKTHRRQLPRASYYVFLTDTACRIRFYLSKTVIISIVKNKINIR